MTGDGDYWSPLVSPDERQKTTGDIVVTAGQEEDAILARINAAVHGSPLVQFRIRLIRSLWSWQCEWRHDRLAPNMKLGDVVDVDELRHFYVRRGLGEAFPASAANIYLPDALENRVWRTKNAVWSRTQTCSATRKRHVY